MFGSFYPLQYNKLGGVKIMIDRKWKFWLIIFLKIEILFMQIPYNNWIK